MGVLAAFPCDTLRIPGYRRVQRDASGLGDQEGPCGPGYRIDKRYGILSVHPCRDRDITKEVEDVNYIEKLFNYLLPGNSDDGYRKDNGVNGLYGAAKGKDFRFTDEDYADAVMGKGKMVGDLSGIDWFEFTVKPLSYRICYQYFGELSNRNLRSVAVEEYMKESVCDICGMPINRYSGLCDECGQPSVRRIENRIRAFHDDMDIVKPAIRLLREEFGNGNIGDLSPGTSLIVSSREVAENMEFPKRRKAELLNAPQSKNTDNPVQQS